CSARAARAAAASAETSSANSNGAACPCGGASTLKAGAGVTPPSAGAGGELGELVDAKPAAVAPRAAPRLGHRAGCAAP
ncbi:MAG TPA: hypothetical protein VI197_06375, partial [Polyangiaceae bacterium]